MNRTRSPLSFLIVCAVATLPLTAACDRRDAGGLPPEETFYLPTPAEEALSASQALCASDTAAYDELVARIDAYNDALADRIALLRALQQRTARQLDRTGEAEIVVERERATVTLHAVEDDTGAVVYDVSVAVDGGAPITFLEGDADAERASGTWRVLKDGDVVVDVAWENDADADVLTVDRTVHGVIGERSSHYVRTAETVDITFTGPNHDAVASWDRATKDGQITIDGNTTCFDASEDAVDFCTIPCTEP